MLGLGIWPASIILSRWAVQYGAALFNNKVVVELGAGCGLPAIATGMIYNQTIRVLKLILSCVSLSVAVFPCQGIRHRYT